MFTDDQLPPQNLDAEKALLSSILLNNERMDEVTFLAPEHFYSGANLTIFDTLRRLLDRQDGGVDLVTLAEAIERRGELGNVGGPAYLAEVCDAAPHDWHAKYYAKLVFEAWQRRELIYVSRQLIKDARSSNSASDIALGVEARLHEIVAPSVARREVPIGEALTRMFAAVQAGRQIGPPTGFRVLDEMLDGLAPRGMVVVGARPGTGKTALLGGIALNAAMRGVAVQFFSLEMPCEQLAERTLCAAGELPAWAIRHPEKCDEITQDMINMHCTRVADLPLFVDDDATKTAAQIAAAARLARRRRNAGLIIVDYLQLVRPEDRRKPREQQVAEISGAFRVLSRQLECPVVVAAQLNRGSESRPDKRPQLSDLRESGSLEQDADQVLLLNRPKAADGGIEDTAEIIVAKNRGGKTGVVELEWRGEMMAFRDPAPKYDQDYRFEGAPEDDG